MSRSIQLNQEQNRILSIDFFRGFTMFMLVCGIEGLFSNINLTKVGLLFLLLINSSHVPWIGLHFWDLIQPFFMFIVGVAMPFSFSRRWEEEIAGKKHLTMYFFAAFYC